jgi:hypothetical protein
LLGKSHHLVLAESVDVEFASLVGFLFVFMVDGWLLPSSGPALWQFSRPSAINF